MEERELLGDPETEPLGYFYPGHPPAYQEQHLGAEASTMSPPALDPWTEGHREHGGWAIYPRKYQRAANGTKDRVRLSQEGL